jgi:putative PIN family toxin of toxin-antitoxin system
MKIVFDTNVLISTFVFKGFSKEVFEYCFSYHQLYTSPWILNEFQEKMREKLKVPEDKISVVIELIKEGFKIINPTGAPPRICRDEDDNNILLLAKFIKAEYIVTGDKDLLSLIEYEGTQIESPRGFWEKTIKEEEKRRTPSSA